jgi:predicted phage-related endonuclease
MMPLNQRACFVAERLGYDTHAVDPINRRDEWLRLRSRDITASVAAALFNVHEFSTAYKLWVYHCGLTQYDPVETPAMRRGRLLEPVAVELLRERQPTWEIERACHYFRDPVHRIGATPDVFAVDPDRYGFGIIQVKSVEQSVFARKWRNENLELEPPLWIAVQASVEADLTGADWACVVALVVGFGVDLYVIDVPLFASVMETLRERVGEFWSMVGQRKPPPVDYRRDQATLLALHGLDDGSTIDLTGWNRFFEMADQDRKLAAQIKDAKFGRRAIRAELLDRLGKASAGMIDGRIVATAKTITRKAHTVQESRYRDVKIK